MGTFPNSGLRQSIGVIVIILWVLVLLGYSFRAESKPVYAGHTPVIVAIKKNTWTVLEFDSAVKMISQAEAFNIKPANQNAPDYTVLKIKPRKWTSDKVVLFKLDSGKDILAKFRVTNGSNASLSYEFKSASGTIGPGNLRVTELDLMRAMIADHLVSGYRYRKLSQSIWKSKKGVSVDLVRIYKGANFNGFVYKVTNHMWTKPFTVDLRNLKIGDPNLAVLSQIDNPTLSGRKIKKNVGFLRVVTKPEASYREFVVPVQERGKK